MDTFLTRLPRQLVLWAVTCTACAAPSYIWAVEMGEFSQAGMITGVACFILLYTLVASTDWFHRFKKIPGMYPTLCIGYGTRVVSALLFPVGMAIDVVPGMISVQLSQAFWNAIYAPIGPTAEPFHVTFTATLIQGVIINMLLVFYMLFTFAIVHPIAKSRHYREGLCQTCGYDLRATTEACPECGEPVPEGHRPTLAAVERQVAAANKVEGNEAAANGSPAVATTNTAK